MKSPLRRRNRASGFSLLEVLIALVVLAFGLLGLALLQTMNLRYTQTANQRTQAVNLGNELLDMIRSNRSQLGSYAMTDASFASVTVPKNGCDAGDILGAAANVARWQCEVREALGPDATATVTVSAAPTVTVNVTWDESTLDAVAVNGNQIELETRL